MKTCAVYHWWTTGSQPYENTVAPIALSIATLRAVSDIPIVVFDISNDYKDWGDLPKRLNFRVEKVTSTLEPYKDIVPGWKHLSRLFDIEYWGRFRLPQDATLMYVDSDVFFLKDPLPLACNPGKFCWDNWNTGFFYYNSWSKDNQKLLEIFKTFSITAFFDEAFRERLRASTHYDSWYGVWDEMVLKYISSLYPELFTVIPKFEHTTAKTLKSVDPREAKMFHCNSLMVGDAVSGYVHSRGVICLIFREFYEKLTKFLGLDDLNRFFSAETIRYYLERQLSILDSRHAFDLCRVDEHRFSLNRLLEL
jgi:hypothetical protein